MKWYFGLYFLKLNAHMHKMHYVFCLQYWRSRTLDYSERFVGHCNTTTDIKEANFFGNDTNYVIAG